MTKLAKYDVRNKRLAYIAQNPEYFAVAAIKIRHPLLYQQYFGLDVRRSFAPEMSLVERVLANIDDKRYHDAIQAEESEEEEANETERQLAESNLVREAKELFLAGKVVEFNYQYVDDSESKYWNWKIEEQDLEEAYFDHDD
ncbi:hypothetical protein HDV03_003862 [Kappamyces sp. JEL0829]|nr:hypothetical protein HDV03_003862 [Kappamyces sp. JEL0829]